MNSPFEIYRFFTKNLFPILFLFWVLYTCLQDYRIRKKVGPVLFVLSTNFLLKKSCWITFGLGVYFLILLPLFGPTEGVSQISGRGLAFGSSFLVLILVTPIQYLNNTRYVTKLGLVKYDYKQTKPVLIPWKDITGNYRQEEKPHQLFFKTDLEEIEDFAINLKHEDEEFTIKSLNDFLPESAQIDFENNEPKAASGNLQ